MSKQRPTPSRFGLCPSCKKRGVRWQGAVMRVCMYCGWAKAGA
jgi:ribosomal protein L37AE/L43A